LGLTSISVRNFQSIKKADLELGNFTVIVGPSSSGKSAMIRAFRALANNVRGSGMITRGQKQMAITARTNTHVITLERTERSGSYRLAGADGEMTFTKLAGEVPQHVADALRLDEGVNFAAQFDKPFLLDESGATVARQLAELTKVNLIFEAVRQANRIRSTAASTLKTRRGDLDAIRTKVAAYQDLPARLKLLAEAEGLDGSRRELAARIGRLNTAIRTLRITEQAVAKTQLAPLPDTESFEATVKRLQSLQERLNRLQAATGAVEALAKALLSAFDVAGGAELDFKMGLQQLGVCPTCGQAM
jgi:DNA repair exonuclease SbcCD ATPase subunit